VGIVTRFVTFITGHPDSIVFILKTPRDEIVHDFKGQEANGKGFKDQKLIEDNDWTRAELARYLGISRAWVTIVMRELEKI
jgi:hypothetical protein